MYINNYREILRGYDISKNTYIKVKGVKDIEKLIRMALNRRTLSKEIKDKILVDYNKVIIRKLNKNFKDPIIRSKEDRYISINNRDKKIIHENISCYKNLRATSSKWAGGEVTLYLNYGMPKIKVRKKTAYSNNRKWRGINKFIELTVQPQWYTNVVKEGLLVLDGLITTSAIKLNDYVWECTWIKPSLSMENTTIEYGFIVESAGMYYHASNLAEAEDLIRKSKEVLRSSLSEISNTDLIKKFGKLTLSSKDSYAAGNCKEGTRQWLLSRFPNKGSVRLKEAILADPDNPRVRSACLVRVKRYLSTPLVK